MIRIENRKSVFFITRDSIGTLRVKILGIPESSKQY